MSAFCCAIDNAGLEKYFYEEPLHEWDWEISDSTKTILGYECIEATTMFNGRKWTAWFTPEIPLDAGPWKLEGLPGLIMEATAGAAAGSRMMRVASKWCSCSFAC